MSLEIGLMLRFSVMHKVVHLVGREGGVLVDREVWAGRGTGHEGGEIRIGAAGCLWGVDGWVGLEGGMGLMGLLPLLRMEMNGDCPGDLVGTGIVIEVGDGKFNHLAFDLCSDPHDV
jgi:hypothetical protein